MNHHRLHHARRGQIVLDKNVTFLLWCGLLYAAIFVGVEVVRKTTGPTYAVAGVIWVVLGSFMVLWRSQGSP
jgi:hypothetical protein